MLIVSAFVNFNALGQTGTIEDYSDASGTSVFYDESFTKEEFIEDVNNYKPRHVKSSETGIYYDEGYKTGFIDAAEFYFDISTSYGFDPRVTFCTGIQESAYGTSKIANDKCNYWGIGAVDGAAYDRAYTYDSIQEGITALCELLKEYTTNGTEKNKMILEKGYDPNTIEGIGSIYATDSSWAEQKKQHMKNIFNT